MEYLYPNDDDAIAVRVAGSSGYVNATGLAGLFSIQVYSVYYHLRTLKKDPARGLVGLWWSVGNANEGTFDNTRCRAWLKEIKKVDWWEVSVVWLINAKVKNPVQLSRFGLWLQRYLPTHHISRIGQDQDR